MTLETLAMSGLVYDDDDFTTLEVLLKEAFCHVNHCSSSSSFGVIDNFYLDT